MSETYLSTVLLAAVYALILYLLVRIWLRERHGTSALPARPFGNKTARLEQKLVFDAVAAIARSRSFEEMLRTVGKQARELIGCQSWILWIRRDDGTEATSQGGAGLADGPSVGLVPQKLWDWVRANRQPLKLPRDSKELVDNPLLCDQLKNSPDSLCIPFLDGDSFLGFILLFGSIEKGTARSQQFLNLFGAFSAILIRRSLIEQKEVELSRERQRSQRLASMGTMAAGIAHDIRNPLTFIRSAAEHMSGNVDLSDEDRQYSLAMVDEIDRINDRIEDLLSLGRIDVKSFRTLDVTDVIRRLISLMKPEADSRNIILDFRNNCQHPVVSGNEARLQDLFQNLLTNAFHAVDSDGHIRVQMEGRGDQLHVYVLDSGPGVDEHVREHMFEPYFSTSESGTGLGLSICHTVAMAHAGTISLVESRGWNTAFLVTLPLAEQHPEETDEPTATT